MVVVGTCFISYRANSIAIQYNSIAQMQLDISKAENQPSFLISCAVEEDLKGNEKGNHVVYISNEGSSCDNIRIETACFVNVTSSIDYSVFESTFTVKDFYWVREWTGNKKGLLCRISCEGNWERFSELYFDALNDENTNSSVSIELYARIIYQDIFGEEHINYYSINNLKQHWLTQEDGEKIFKKYNEEPNELSIDELTWQEVSRILFEEL